MTKLNKFSAFNLLIFFLCLFTRFSEAQEFSYDGSGPQGPSHWGEQYKTCSGKHQSPINIDELKVVDYDFPVLQMDNFEEVPESVQVVNNGHTVMIKMKHKPGKEPILRGGPLGFFIPGFQFEQFHLHWGANDTVGSEDLINNASYPAELHMVFRNLMYKNFESALNQGDGIVVLAYFFEISRSDNPSFKEFTELLKEVPRAGMSVNFENPIQLKEFMSYDILHYYTYIGSLTTPPCSEDVVWIDFSTSIRISENQINQLRKLRADEKHPLTNNFRPTQPLNDRKVYKASLGDMPNYFFQSMVPFVDAANGVRGMNSTKVWSMWLCLIGAKLIIISLLRKPYAN